MRKIKRMRRNKQKKIILITSITLLLFLTIGYAAFQTNLNITAKANIKTIDITDKVVTSGDGLYETLTIIFGLMRNFGELSPKKLMVHIK